MLQSWAAGRLLSVKMILPMNATCRGPLVLLVGLLTLLPMPGWAIAPAAAGHLKLEAPVVQLRTATAAPRMVALLATTANHPAYLQLLDLSKPDAPSPRGTSPLPGTPTDLALSGDGQSALVVVQSDKSPSGLRDTSQISVLAFDLSQMEAPRLLWQRPVGAVPIVLAPDASAWARSEPTTALPIRWQTTIEWMDAARAPVTLPGTPARATQLARQGEWLAWSDPANSQLGVVRLGEPQANAVAAARHATRHLPHHCASALLDSGHLVIEDLRASRLGIYAPADRLPRLTSLPHEGTAHCTSLGQDTEGHLLIAGQAGQLRRVQIARPDAAVVDGQWQLPHGMTPRAASGVYLYATANDTLHVFRLDRGNAVDVDWAALDRTHQTIMARNAQALAGGEPKIKKAVLATLEQAGATLAPDSPIAGLAPRRAATILSDFGYLLSSDPTRYALAEFALKRANVLDPGNAAAAVRLADLWRAHLPLMSEAGKHAQRRNDITALYRRHLRLAGTAAAPHAKALAIGDPAQDLGDDLCMAVLRHARVGRLPEMLLTSAVNLPIGPTDPRRVDLVLTKATVTTPAMVYGFDATTDEPLEATDLPVPMGKAMPGGTLALATWRGMTQLLHYRDLRHPPTCAPGPQGKPSSVATRAP